MGPLAGHHCGTGRCDCNPARTGKTKADHKSGKHARRLANRHKDPIREGGGKQFRK